MIFRLLYPFLRWCPGALGIVLRQKLYHRLLGNCGRNILIGRFVDLHNPQNIRIGDQAIINDHAVLRAPAKPLANPAIILDRHAFVGSGTTLTARGGTIHLHPGSNLGSGCTLWAASGIDIGPNTLLAAYCTLEDGGSDSGDGRSPSSSGQLIVDGGCWLGVRARVTGPIRIGKESVIGAHSLVNGDIPPYAIAYGNPATVGGHRRPR